MSGHNINGSLPVGILDVVEIIPAGRVDTVLHQPGEVPLPGPGVVPFQCVGPCILFTNAVPVVGPDGLEHGLFGGAEAHLGLDHAQLGQLDLEDFPGNGSLDDIGSVQAVHAVGSEHPLLPQHLGVETQLSKRKLRKFLFSDVP